jgi:hypothetical protein
VGAGTIDDLFNGIVPITRFANHSNVLFHLQERTHPLSHKHVIVSQKDSNVSHSFLIPPYISTAYLIDSAVSKIAVLYY